MLEKTLAFLQWVEGVSGAKAGSSGLYDEAMEEVKSLRGLPEVVLLAGSARFQQAFEEEAYRMSLQGLIVLGKHVFKPGDQWPLPEGAKNMIHAVQFRKADLANRLHIVNVDGYVGQDTYNLIKYALKHDKPVTFREERVRLIDKHASLVTAHHFLQGAARTAKFEEAAMG